MGSSVRGPRLRRTGAAAAAAPLFALLSLAVAVFGSLGGVWAAESPPVVTEKLGPRGEQFFETTLPGLAGWYVSLGVGPFTGGGAGSQPALQLLADVAGNLYGTMDGGRSWQPWLGRLLAPALPGPAAPHAGTPVDDDDDEDESRRAEEGFEQELRKAHPVDYVQDERGTNGEWRRADVSPSSVSRWWAPVRGDPTRQVWYLPAYEGPFSVKRWWVTRDDGRTWAPVRNPVRDVDGIVVDLSSGPRAGVAVISVAPWACVSSSQRPAWAVAAPEGCVGHSLFLTRDYGQSYFPIDTHGQRGFVELTSAGDIIYAATSERGRAQGMPNPPLVANVEGRRVRGAWGSFPDSQPPQAPQTIVTSVKDVVPSQRWWGVDDSLAGFTPGSGQPQQDRHGDVAYFAAQPYLENGDSSVVLHMTRDGGETFKTAQFPERLQPQYFTAADPARDGLEFIVVRSSSETRGSVTDLYASDAGNPRFSLSTWGIKSQYWRRSTGWVDVEKIYGVDGAYVANVVDDTTGGIRTLFTWDQGGNWDRLKPPATDKEGRPWPQCAAPSAGGGTDECHLNLAGLLENVYGRFYSVPNSMGMMIGNGNVGSDLSRDPKDISVFFSNNLGASWTELAEGPHGFEISNWGGLIVMYSTAYATDNITYSADSGATWVTTKFTDAGPVAVRNIEVEGSSTSTTLLLHGTRTSPSDGTRTRVYVSMDFTVPATPRSCASNDFEVWTPSVDLPDAGCMLGNRTSYLRRKVGVACSIPPGTAPNRIVATGPCMCAREDVYCDFCFAPRSQWNNTECLPMNDCAGGANPAEPPVPCVGTFQRSRGYRLLPNDVCLRPERLHLLPFRDACPASTATTTTTTTTLPAPPSPPPPSSPGPPTGPVCSPPCRNGGKCHRNGYCVCDGTGFGGRTCTLVNRCDPPCRNGGVCEKEHICSCPEGFPNVAAGCLPEIDAASDSANTTDRSNAAIIAFVVLLPLCFLLAGGLVAVYRTQQPAPLYNVLRRLFRLVGHRVPAPEGFHAIPAEVLDDDDDFQVDPSMGTYGDEAFDDQYHPDPDDGGGDHDDRDTEGAAGATAT